MGTVVEPAKSGLCGLIDALLDVGPNTLEERVAEVTLRLAYLKPFKDSIPTEIWIELLSIIAELRSQSPAQLFSDEQHGALAERLLALYIKIDGGILIY